jgi:hemerythrin superfamily protein
MSIIDKVVAAVTPPESAEARAEARQKARAAASDCQWLSVVLQHHQQIEDAFATVKSARDAASRRSAQKRLALVLTGHAVAEESVLYPALALHGEKAHATQGYTEQSAVKIQMAALDELDPMSQDYDDKFEHIRGAVLHHMYEEEGNWFPDLVEKIGPGGELAARFEEEFDRYTGGGSTAQSLGGMTSMGGARTS